ncbi:uncharacterized protein NEMAJ01_0538 [Nematocida major]|uniref:uncharacterized protein n=1 Tax=Nematocida major TaxID=1912982 RepID=UPI0020086772|nr:uncharacterized protein NEMAJ01_0538 [Nematocida major]KAH9385642.1 hypothetical protein NEMAJ01_0538 [Nematocida major]
MDAEDIRKTLCNVLTVASKIYKKSTLHTYYNIKRCLATAKQTYEACFHEVSLLLYFEKDLERGDEKSFGRHIKRDTEEVLAGIDAPYKLLKIATSMLEACKRDLADSANFYETQSMLILAEFNIRTMKHGSCFPYADLFEQAYSEIENKRRQTIHMETLCKQLESLCKDIFMQISTRLQRYNSSIRCEATKKNPLGEYLYADEENDHLVNLETESEPELM